MIRMRLHCCRALLLLLAASGAFAASRKTVFIVTDGEGVAGICRQEQTDPKEPELRQLLTGEVNAAVDGFLAGGADEVIVYDGHGGSATLSAATIHPRAKLVIGALEASLSLDRKYTALAFVGQHSMAGVRGGIMAHTFSSLGIQRLLVNGKPAGEIAVIGALAGFYGTPVIFLSGDRAAADELQALVPQAEVAVVKEGLARYSCISLSAVAACNAIREGARQAMTKVAAIPPYRIDGPVTIEIERTTRNSLPIGAGQAPGTELVDDRTIRYRGENILEAWKVRSR
jgi:D-amino peptidase